MSKKEIKRLVILNIPYLILGLLATNLGEAWRLAEGTDTKTCSYTQKCEMWQDYPHRKPSEAAICL